MPTTKIIKFGKGAAIVIPPEYMKEKNIKVGDIVSFEVYKIKHVFQKEVGPAPRRH